MTPGRLSSLREAFFAAPRLTTKYSNYFEIYERLLADFTKADLVLIEIGVADGGSLHMWRKFLGAEARIIGIDFDPNALELVKDGFEIYIGDQSSQSFLETTFESIGRIDVIIDDGGHSNLQQVNTLTQALRYINEGGMIIFEDTHASFMPIYGNPSKASFLNLAKGIIDEMHQRSPNITSGAPNGLFARSVHSIEFFESVAVFKINRSLATKKSEHVANQGLKLIDQERRGGASNSIKLFSNLFASAYYREYPMFDAIIKKMLMKLRSLILGAASRRDVKKIKKLMREASNR